MSSSDQYVFELQFKCKADGTDYRENQFVIIDGSSMADFSKLKEDLALCMPEPFKVQYIDDDEDIISIDTEEEFQEFAKIAKKRSARGMLMRLILNLNVSDNGQTPLRSYLSPETRHPSAGGTKTNSKNPANLESARSPSLHGSRFNMLKDIIKQELRHEILSELKEMGPAGEAGVANTNNDPSVSTKNIGVTEEEMKGAEYMEDSDGNGFVLYPLEKKKTKIQKRLEKRERLVEMKIDQRLEKLEMKRKKLMERYNNQRVASPKAVPLPRIVSAIATNESLEILKPVAVAKVFTHVWTILNDGLVSLENVELRHTWSSPGLEPLETSVKLAYLIPGQQGTVAVRFNAPKIHAYSFTSYWHLFYLDNSQWREFGHYVSMTGSTKQPKATKYDFLSQVPEGKKKRKQDHHVTLMEKMEALFTEQTPKEGQEEKVLNEESTSNITLKKQMEQLQATLASSEIAAEMAREAARLLARASASAEGNTASPSKMAKPSEGDKLNNCGLDEAAAGVQQLNLLDSESDTDANMETNEDLDRGFVIVPSMVESDNQSTNMPKEVSKEENKNIAPPTGNAGEGVQAQSTGMPFARQDPNVPYPVFPPPPRVGMVGNPLFTPQSHNMMHNNMFNYPMFPPSQNPHGIVLPPPANYPFPPVPLHIPISTPPTFVSRCMEPMPNAQYPARQTNEMFWDASNEVRQWSSANSNETQTESPAETEAPSNTAAPAENSTVNASAEASQPQPPSKPQPISQPQPQPQPQAQQPTEAYPANNEQPRNPEPVQILPQALVDGAINVAATAYSTAWNALNNLRPKEGEASEFDPVFENNMAMLVEMGFNNLERNARLLKRFHNDISQVIGVICATGGSHNLDID